MKKSVLCAVAAIVVISLSACGGGGGGNNGPAVTVSPATANVQENSTLQFSATVTNTTSTAVNWEVNGTMGGNATIGTISNTGLYAAPLAIPNPPSVTITAVLQTDSSVSGNAIATVTAVTFNNSSLKGNYVLSLTGVDGAGSAFNLLGAITADGNGNITGGEADLNDISSGYAQATSVTGTYNVGSDGRGTLSVNAAGISSGLQYTFAVRANNTAAVSEVDSVVTAGTGNLEGQSSPAAPSGNYAFGFAGAAGGCGGGLTSAGLFMLSSGTIGGVQDVNCSGSIVQSQSLSGSYTTSIDGLGRGTGTLTGATTGTSNLVYYAISGNRFRLLCPDNGTLFLGSADSQTQSSFSQANFSGPYVVNISANTSNGVLYSLISLNASGGNISTGYYDANNSGSVGQASLTGAYSVASNGRVSGSFSVNSSSIPFAIYLISPTQGYYVDERTTVTGSGNVYAQNSSLTTNAGWAGSYATRQFGYFLVGGVLNPTNASGVSGQISADGNGNLAGTLDINDPSGVILNQTLQGTYSVGTVAPGRATLSITTPTEGTRNYVGYIVDSGRVLLLETDNNLVSSGDVIRQF